MRPRLLDLFCGAGGAAVGYARAGFDVTGIDIEPHPDYPFPMVVGDAMTLLACPVLLEPFAAFHASPPCPRWSTITMPEHREDHPDLLTPTRDALLATGRPYVIENVPGAPLRNPAKLCGSSFGLGVRRHRMFESNVFLMTPECEHPQQGTPIGVYGHGGGTTRRKNGTSRGIKTNKVDVAQKALGITHMHKLADLADAIPPAYTECIGEQLLARGW